MFFKNREKSNERHNFDKIFEKNSKCSKNEASFAKMNKNLNYWNNTYNRHQKLSKMIICAEKKNKISIENCSFGHQIYWIFIQNIFLLICENQTKDTIFEEIFKHDSNCPKMSRILCENVRKSHNYWKWAYY